MQTESLWQLLFRGGPTMLILIICSLVSWVVILERWWVFRKALQGSERLVSRVCKLVRAGKYDEASGLTQSEEGCMASILHSALSHPGRGRRSLEEAVERRTAEEIMNLESRLGILGTLGSTAPYIGLFGTVLGIISAFQALAVSNQAGANVVSAGIAEALVCTAAGLAVAVPSVVAYNMFSKKLSQIDTRCAIACSELVQAFFEKGERQKEVDDEEI